MNARADELSWQQDAACRGMSPETFFPGPWDFQAMREAKQVCAGCPVKTECLDFASSMACTPPGIWGGVSECERKKMRRGSRTE